MFFFLYLLPANIHDSSQFAWNYRSIIITPHLPNILDFFQAFNKQMCKKIESEFFKDYICHQMLNRKY